MSDISRTDSSMSEYSPLSQACIKALTDRLDDKRKFAANEIEKMTAEFSMSNNLVMVNRLIIVLGRRFCLSQHQNTRKGGLLGLAAVMVGFKNGSLSQPPSEMVEEVVRPILTCLLDSDPRVRHYACEALFNVTKVARANILHQFELIFDSLSKMVADNDISVRSSSESLDRLLKDIIVETSELKLDNFVLRLQEYIYTKNSYTRMFIVSWIRLLDSKMDIINYLPNLLDGIFNCLRDSNDEIRAAILILLSEFLNKIVTRPSDQANLSSLMTILLKYTRADRDGHPVQYTAIAWIRQIIRLLDGAHLLTFTTGILSAILPCLAYQPFLDDTTLEQLDGQQQRNHHLSSSHNNNNSNLSLIHQRTFSHNSSIISHPQRYIPSPVDQGNICEISTLVNSSLHELVINVLSDRMNTSSFDQIAGDLVAILEVLSKELQRQEHPVIRLAILDWFKALRDAVPEFVCMQLSQQKLFQPLLDTLSARSDAVVKETLRVITAIFRDDIQSQTAGDETQQQQLLRRNASAILEDNCSPSRDDEDIQLQQQPEPRKTTSSSYGRSQANQTKTPPASATKRVAIITNECSTTAAQSGPNIQRFIQALYKTFNENEVVFNNRGTFIILNLCSMIAPDRVYNSFAEIIKEERVHLKFAYQLVQKLNQILLTTKPLFVLRSRLSNDSDEPELAALFHNLYLAWCHSPLATITLCFLTNHHRLACEIVTALSKTDITVELLIQIDWIVQMIESPVFAPLRVRLLDASNNQYLLQTLYGLLMVLPQSESYRKLSDRLNQVHRFMGLSNQGRGFATTQAMGSKLTGGPGASSSTTTSSSSGPTKDQSKKSGGGPSGTATSSSNSLDALMKHFHQVQNLRAKHVMGCSLEASE